MAADLHIHSNESDGTHSPAEVVELAARAGVKTIALTDHDAIDGLAEALQAGEKFSVEVIPGVEFTTENRRAEIHILGYFIDPHHTGLRVELEKIQQGRMSRIKKMVNRLNKLGVNLSLEEVLLLSSGKAPGRPHVARALLSAGLVGSVKEAFDRFIDNKGPAYVPHYKLTPAEAIRLIKQAGGLAVLAHPVISRYDEIIPELISFGLQGLEAYYPGYRPDQTEHYLKLARGYKLLITGGSDFHGDGSGREIKLGDFTIPDELVDELKKKYN